MNYLKKLVRIIKKSKRVVIGTHIDPDGDGICGALACAALVRYCNKKNKPILFCHSPISSKYQFLIKDQQFTNQLTDFDLLILVDSADISRVFPDISDCELSKFNLKMVINIDHHKSNNLFGELKIIDENASSVCELIYQLFKQLRIKITGHLAEIFYCGIYSETGGFIYPNTSKNVLTIAAELIGLGVEPEPLVKKLNAKTVAGTLLLSEVLNTIRIKDWVGTMYLTQDMLDKHQADVTDSENFISFLQAINGIHISVFLREEREGVRISMRSDGIVDVDKIARKFGGGGHRLAAGVRMKKDIETARKEILHAISKELKLKGNSIKGKK